MPRALLALAAFATLGAMESLSDEPRAGRPSCGIFGMGALREADGGGGGSAVAAEPPKAAATPPATVPAAPVFDTEKAQADARAAALKELGFADDAAFKADQKKRKEEADAKLSENERNAKALKEALDGRGDIEAKFAEHKTKSAARIKELEAQLETRDTFDREGVAPKERVIVDALRSQDVATKGDKYDEKKFFEELRKERPYLFGTASVATTNATSAKPGLQVPPPASPFATGAEALPNALTMSDEDYRKQRYGRSLRRRLI